ncbi:hypothetical protein [Methylomonas albis]|uniref:Uncharacterized protein n=1 Tax=Methylomonas albis TaxID=1854563 RepID=A0ABR9CW66_9GAMM|nr:hypothetical protein [Methylomonas albis]MBD9355097.1 hypothetical protein [Methylomonas albis]
MTGFSALSRITGKTFPPNRICCKNLGRADSSKLAENTIVAGVWGRSYSAIGNMIVTWVFVLRSELLVIVVIIPRQAAFVVFATI